VPIPIKAGHPARFDYEYKRNGTANLFMMFAPLEGWRHVKVTDRHTAVDYAHVLKDLRRYQLPACSDNRPGQDNLNIHSKASLYEAFPPAEARRLVERFEWHYTPKHGVGSIWRNPNWVSYRLSASIAASPNKQTLIDEVAAWEQERNANHTKANWHFTTSARVAFLAST
jgi:hypothetical protein